MYLINGTFIKPWSILSLHTNKNFVYNIIPKCFFFFKISDLNKTKPFYCVEGTLKTKKKSILKLWKFMRNYIMIIYVLTWYKFPIYAMGKMEWNRYEITWILGTMCILIYNIKSLYTYKYIQNYYILWSGRAPNIKGGYCKVHSLITGSI